MGMLAIGLYTAAGLLSLSGAVQYLDVNTGWTIDRQGPWQSRVDHRELLAMHHPWVESATGNFLMAWRDVEIPEEWGAEVTLHFYSSDDYHGAPQGDLPGVGFVGHRRRQILINRDPVWTQDVADAVTPGTVPMYHVTVPVPPDKRTLRIALLAYDAVDSATRTRDDFYIPTTAGQSWEDDPDGKRFRSTIYWGDLALVSDDTPLPPRPRPSTRALQERHNTFWPPTADPTVWAEQRTTFTISAPRGVPKAGFPLEMGIPFPEGAVSAPEAFRLTGTGNKSLFTQKQVRATWPDGSLRWAMTQFPVNEATKSVTLSAAQDTAKSPAANTVTESEDHLEVDAGGLALQVGRGDPITGISLRNKALIDTLRLSIDVAGQQVPGTNDDWQVLDAGPFHTQLLLQGRFEGLHASLGTYALYCSVYHDLPYIKFWFRYFNDTGIPQALSGLEMRFIFNKAPEAIQLPHGPVESPFSLTQKDPDDYQLKDERHTTDQPFFAQWSEGALTVKDFSELHPKGLRLEEKQLILALVAADSAPVTFTPGEAKSHEVWLALGATDGAQLAATVAQPPLLDSSAYVGSTGVFGPAAAAPEADPWRSFLKATYGDKSLRELGMATGIRHYPDEAYLGVKGKWSNNYNGRLMSLWAAWLATGDRIWFDRAVATGVHLMDVAVVHAEIPGRDWIGALHGPSIDHVGDPWNPLLRGEGFSAFAQLTGNPEAESAFLGVADYAVRTRAGRGGPNVRHWAGAFSTIVAAYRETGEIAMLEGGAERLTGMLAQVDRRRGTWFDWHATATYPGNIPWMDAQLALALYRWYLQTGDLEAADLLVGLADALICENTPWESPGAMRTYSPDPHFPDTTAYDPFIIPMLFAAFTLTEDPFFRDAGLEQWKRWQANPTFQSVFNLGWHMPWLYAELQKHALPVVEEPGTPAP